ncbi:Transcription factor LBX1 [Folsomia candida]|uniref:Transcription factor LBX1 n=1 Tax=Folsomia candida TaxID=158441 RepID=A0A226DTR9_FOLCA|nr:Transcription factor LBX1 [Folsomia candida]
MQPDKRKGKVGLLLCTYVNGVLLIVSLSNVIAYLRAYTSHKIDSTWSPAELATYEFVTLCAYQLWMILNVILFLGSYAYYACLERIKNELGLPRVAKMPPVTRPVTRCPTTRTRTGTRAEFEKRANNLEGFTASLLYELEKRFGGQKGLSVIKVDHLAKRIGRISVAQGKFEKVKRDVESKIVQQPQNTGQHVADNPVKNFTPPMSSPQTSTLKAASATMTKIDKGEIFWVCHKVLDYEVVQHCCLGP